MATERRRAAGMVVAVAALLVPVAVRAQASLFLVGDSTRVSSITFEVAGDDVLSDARRRSRMALTAPGRTEGLQRRFSWLPLVDRPDPHAFDPVTLQKDVVRLREFYRSEGFPQARVDYRVTLDPEADRVDVVMEIDPGPPRLLRLAEFRLAAGADTSALELPSLRASFDRRVGSRLGDEQLRRLQDDVRSWATRRGHPFPEVRLEVEGEADPLATRLVVDLDPGRRARVGRIDIDDGLRLDTATVRRQLLVRPGDVYSPSRMDESARQLLDLDLVQLALVELEPGQPRDSVVDLRVRLLEGTPRLVSGRAGYTDDRGILTDARWQNRSFLGGGRTFQLAAQAETGVLAFEEFPRELYGVTATLDQPYLWDPRVSLLTDVYGEVEDSRREKTRRLGVDMTLLLDRGPNRFISVAAGVALRDVLEFRVGGLGTLGVLDAFRVAQDLERSTVQTTLTLSAAWGERDDFAFPSRGWTARTSLTAAGADPWSDAQYLRADGAVAGLLQLHEGGPRVLARARAGRIVPWGRSSSGNPFREYLRFGDAVFTEGGTQRVRGWEADLLGPKFPDFRVDFANDSIVLSPGGRYVPLGGLARAGASLEMQLPLPGLGRDGYALLFLEGARVWTPDGRYTGDEGLAFLAVDDDAYYGTGGGLALPSPLGPIRVMVGYKLNPSILDQIDPGDFAALVLDPTIPVESIERRAIRRWRLHIGIGQVF